MDTFFNTLAGIWENSIVRAFTFLILALLLGWIASLAAKKLLKLVIPKSKQEKWEKRGGTAIKMTGKLIFLVVFLLFLPSVLEALGLDTVTDPITEFVSTFINYIPNVIAAAILIFIGIFVGQILEEVVGALLAKTGLDSLAKRLVAKGESDSEDAESAIGISSIVGKTVNGAIVLISIVEALTVLNIEAISTPALSIIDAIFGVVPSIFLAVIVITIGVVISNIACAFLKNILTGINLDGLIKGIAPGMHCKFSFTSLAVNVVRVMIILFVVAEGVDILGLGVLSGITSVIISYLPLVIKALVIAAIAVWSASLADAWMKKSGLGGILPKILKSIIYVVAAFMILSQLEFASIIVNYAFIITLSALAVAFAIAFGIGGKDFAKKALDKVNLPSKANESEQEKAD